MVANTSADTSCAAQVVSVATSLTRSRPRFRSLSLSRLHSEPATSTEVGSVRTPVFAGTTSPNKTPTMVSTWSPQNRELTLLESSGKQPEASSRKKPRSCSEPATSTGAGRVHPPVFLGTTLLKTPISTWSRQSQVTMSVSSRKQPAAFVGRKPRSCSEPATLTGSGWVHPPVFLGKTLQKTTPPSTKKHRSLAYVQLCACVQSML